MLYLFIYFGEKFSVDAFLYQFCIRLFCRENFYSYIFIRIFFIRIFCREMYARPVSIETVCLSNLFVDNSCILLDILFIF
jgi:hypothetical protein